MKFLVCLFAAAFVAIKGFKVPLRVRHSRNLIKVHGVVRGRYGDRHGDKDGQENYKLVPYAESDEDSDQIDAIEPGLRELFPLPGTVAHAVAGEAPVYDREEPNWLELEVDDPLWLDKAWPTESGPESTAYAKHLQWKRSLPDGERVRWQKWAIYDRMLKKDQFEYGVEDFVRQSMVTDIAAKASKYEKDDMMLEANLWKTVIVGFQEEDKSEVEAAVKSFYSAFNRKNYDEMRVLLLPCETTSCNLPGHDRTVGVGRVHKTYKRILTTTKPMATVRPEVVSVTTSGFVAVVQVVEHVEAGGVGAGDLKKIGNRQEQKLAAQRKLTGEDSRGGEVKTLRQVHSTFVLRKYNQQWRILLHEAVPVKNSDYCADSSLGGATAARNSKRDQGDRSKAKGMFRDTVGKLLRNSIGTEKGEKGDALESAAASAASREIAKALTKKGLPPEIVKVLSDSAGRSIVSGDGGPSVRQFNTGGLNGFIIKGPGAPADPTNRAKNNGTPLTSENSVGRARIGPDGRSVEFIDVEEEQKEDNDNVDDNGNEDDDGDGGSGGNELVGRGRRPNPPIDESGNISKQTMQALRLLVQAGRITRATKDALVMDMIDCITDKKPSMAEQAYKMLVHGRLQTSSSGSGSGLLADDVPDDVLEEFGEQCLLIADILNAEGEGSWNNATPDDDEDDEDDDSDGEEDEALIAALAGSLASSSSSSSLGAGGKEDDPDRDDDEEAVIAALAGSLK